MPTPRTTTPKNRTLEVLLVRPDRKIRITIPAVAKVTYGSLHPGVKGGFGGDAEGSAVLRIYEGTKQTAMFRNVKEFRDLAYTVEVEQVFTDVSAEAVQVDGRVVRDDSRLARTAEWAQLR